MVTSDRAQRVNGDVEILANESDGEPGFLKWIIERLRVLRTISRRAFPSTQIRCKDTSCPIPTQQLPNPASNFPQSRPTRQQN